jgi:hypothetical protein
MVKGTKTTGLMRKPTILRGSDAKTGVAAISSRLEAVLPPHLRKHLAMAIAAAVVVLALLLSHGTGVWGGTDDGSKGLPKAKSRASRKPPPFRGSKGCAVKVERDRPPPHTYVCICFIER